MQRLSCHIKIANLSFDFVSEVEIESAWDKLTTRAKIIIPRNVKLKDGGVLPQIKKGDPVEIYLGYDGDNQEQFIGYVSQIKADLPLEIECEDEMWQLKQIRVSNAWKKVSLQTMLSTILPGYTIRSQDMDLGAFRISEVSAAKVLDALKRQYGLRSFFVGKILYVGLLHPLTPVSWNYSFQYNIISNQLEYLSQDDHKIKLKAISILPNGKKIEEELGDPDGESRTLHYYNLDQSSLKEAAQAEIDKLKRSGYKGSFLAFGDSSIFHGDAVSLLDDEYPDREGSYQVEGVTTRFGQGGYRKEIKLGAKL